LIVRFAGQTGFDACHGLAEPGVGSRLFAEIDAGQRDHVNAAALFTVHRSEVNLRLYALRGYVKQPARSCARTWSWFI